jgi:hypothetical protein
VGELAPYKGRVTPTSIERDFPHIVEIAVPPGGLGKTLDAMYEFHTRYGIRAKLGRNRHEDDRDYIRWRFADPAIAKSFATVFAVSE